jgi:hypothetical protein
MESVEEQIEPETEGISWSLLDIIRRYYKPGLVAGGLIDE